MKILTYRELESKDALLPLLDNAFGWPFNPRMYEKLVKIDPRVRNSPVGFCAVENERVIGHVGVMDLTTRTLDGNVEYVGGIYGVATLPSHARKGISTALMTRVHEHFRERNYRFSFLCTSHTLVAYSMYQKLGYTDLLERPSVYKVLNQRKTKAAAEQISGKIDFDKLLKVYWEFVKGKTGFVVRDKVYLEMLKKTGYFSSRDCIIEEDGYVIFRSNIGGTWSKATWIRELVASNAEQMNRLAELVEAKAKDLIMDRDVLDNTLLQVYKSRGYMAEKRSHGVIMVKPLAADVSFKETYGDKFFLTDLDFF
jgi:ribosomal protein S18 acetylase RimI-like enzyme